MKAIYQKNKIPIWLIISGFFTALPLIITELGFVQWISVVPAAVILIRSAEEEIKLKRLYGRGVLFFAVYYSFSFHWFFYMYPLDFAGLSNIASIAVVLVACFGLGLFQAVQSALMFLIFGLVSKNRMISKHKIIIPFLVASLWVIFEWWQTIGWWGVPWARLPLGQIASTELVRSASLFGSYFITFIIIAVNFCLALSIKEMSIKNVSLIVAIFLFCLNLILGFAVTLSYKNEGESIRVAVAQGNISSSEKWSKGSLNKTMRVYKRLTEKAAHEGAELIVWPETAIPYVLFDDEELSSFVSELAVDNEITIMVAAFTEDESGEKIYNSLIEVRPDGSFGEKSYLKRKLVPFGEYVPMRDAVMLLFPPLAEIGMLDSDISAGDDSCVIESEIGNLGCEICFDSIYETVTIDSVRNGAEIILISTNDSWFSDSAALSMHNAQARLRAIESGRYVVRSANTGISSAIDPMGRVTKSIPANAEGYFVEDVCLRGENTLYIKVGNIIVYLCIAFVICNLLSSFSEKYKSVRRHV